MNKCNNCNKSFSTKQRLNYHLENKVCLKRNNSCNNCNKIFSNKQKLNYHLENKVCLNIYICNNCNKKFTNEKIYANHTINNICLLECKYCYEKFKCKQNLIMHINNEVCSEHIHWYNSKRYVADKQKYNLFTVFCYNCGDYLENCKDDCLELYIQKIIKRKKYLDLNVKFICTDDDYFDNIVPFENREYWTEDCSRCFNIRDSNEHIFNCMKTKTNQSVYANILFSI